MNYLDQELIDQYLRKKLTDSELEDFELRIKKDIEFSKKVKAQQEAISVIKEMGDTQTKAVIKNVISKNRGTQEPKTNRNLKVVLFLLGLLFLMIIGYILSSNSSINELSLTPNTFVEYYEPPDLKFGTRGSDEEVLVAASIAYSKSDYNSALKLFLNSQSEVKSSKVDLAIGICYMELDQLEEAKTIFTNGIDDPLFGDQNRWYLALLLLKESSPEATEHFEALASDPSAFYHSKAKEILK